MQIYILVVNGCSFSILEYIERPHVIDYESMIDMITSIYSNANVNVLAFVTLLLNSI